MEILQGLMTRQVLQRNAHNVCETIFSGRCSVNGTLQLRVTKGSRALSGLNFKTIAKIRKGSFKLKLAGIPTGGPYKITLRLVPGSGGAHRQLQIDDVLVGDVWILAGQSNMEGIGLLRDAAEAEPLVRAFYTDDRWAPAKDPIHNLWAAVDPVHTDLHGGEPVLRGRYIGTGPGVAFGQEMLRLTGVPQGLICCAHGGSSMDQWDPKLKKLGGKSLYGAMLRRFRKNGSNVAGVIWYQGESDAVPPLHNFYTAKMKRFTASIRRDFGLPKLPFVMAQLASYCTSETPRLAVCWNLIQQQQRLLPKAVEKLAVVPTIDLDLDDSVHISGKAQQRLGKRLAQAARALIEGKKAARFPIELKSIRPVLNRRKNTVDIEVAFANVADRLQAQGRPSGFKLIRSDGTTFDGLYRIDLKGSKAIVRTGILAGEKYKLSLYYGFGFSPYCNITDAEDRSLPVFGPYPVRLKKLQKNSRRL